MKRNTHRFTMWLAIAALAVAPVVMAQGVAQNVNTSQTITVFGQGAANTCYTPTAGQLAANPTCNFYPATNIPISGEWVDLAGTITITSHYELDPDGDHMHLKTTTHSELTGTGQCSGAKYVEKDDGNSDYKLKLNDDGSLVRSDFLQSDKLKLVSQGPLPNMTLTTKTHVVVDKNGSVKTFPDASGSTITKCTK